MKTREGWGEYDGAQMEWLCKLAECLRDALKAQGLEGEKVQTAMHDAVFQLAMIHDQLGIEVEGKTLIPRLGFVDPDGVLLVSDDSYLHEYAGVVDDTFEGR